MGDIYYGTVELKATTTYWYDYDRLALDTSIYGITQDFTNEVHFQVPPTKIMVVGISPHVSNPYLCIKDTSGLSIISQWGLIDELKYMEELELYPDRELMIAIWVASLENSTNWLWDASNCRIQGHEAILLDENTPIWGHAADLFMKFYDGLWC